MVAEIFGSSMDSDGTGLKKDTLASESHAYLIAFTLRIETTPRKLSHCLCLSYAIFLQIYDSSKQLHHRRLSLKENRHHHLALMDASWARSLR